MRWMAALVIPVCALSIVLAPAFSLAAERSRPAAEGTRGAAEVGPTAVRLPPGAPELLLERHPGAGGVCAVVAVPAGSAYETSATRGVSHLIEHLVFDGSERYTRVEMSSWVDDVGGFLNAFTRNETTVYFLVVPSPHAEKGMEVLSQMLLHSIFPPAELDKERKVIIEEIRREGDDPQAARERAVARSLYRGSPLAEPITGSPATIETMSREDVLRFYRAHYAPSRMRIILMGDFDVAEATAWVEDYFLGVGASGAGARKAPRGGTRTSERALEPAWRHEIKAVTDASLTPGFDMLIALPSVADEDFSAALLLSIILGGSESPLTSAFKTAGYPSPELGVELHRDFSALRVHIDAPKGMDVRYDGIPLMFEALATWRPSERAVTEAQVAFSSSEMFDREMYHFYVMSNGEGLGLFGERYIAARTRGIEKVRAADCARVLKRVFESMRFNACRTTAEEAPAAGLGGALPMIEILPNGITVAASARPGSPVAALHLLFKGRNCAEGLSGAAADNPGAIAAGGRAADGPPRGLAEVLATLFESSAAGAELGGQLEAIGARVAFGDNPRVPFDDYLLSPSYSFIRLESPAAVSGQAIGLLVETVLACDFTADDLEAAKKELTREAAMRWGSPMFSLRGAIFRELFGAHPFGASIFPAMPGLGSVTLEEVKSFAKSCVRGGNIVATYVSSEEPSAALVSLRRLLGALPEGASRPCPPLPASAKAGSIELSTKKEGAYLAASWLVPAAGLREAAAILIAAEVLSRRMQLELREKLALAYSTDCTVSLVPGGAVVYAYLGTGAARLGEAEVALEEEVKGLAERVPDDTETAIARNRLIGRRTRSELSSINQAYRLGLDIFLGGGAADGRSMNESLGLVSAADVASTCAGALSFDRALRVKLVPSGASGEPTGEMPVKMPGKPPGKMPGAPGAEKPPVMR